MKPRLLFALALAVVCGLLQLGALPILDEESYLDIAGQLSQHPLRPYDWFRPWQPWGHVPPDNAYLFAHPPGHLWWVTLSGGSRLLASVPLAGVLGFSLAWLGERHLPTLALGLLASPVLLLALQAGLMPDLGVVAWSTLALAAWVHRKPALAGLAFALAASWKYPSLLLALPLIVHAARTRRWRDLGISAGVFLGLWGGLQAFLWIQYGEPHLVHVLANAGEIGRGPLGPRALGVLARLGLAAPPAPTALPGLVLGGLGLLPELDLGRGILVACCGLGGSALLRGLLALRQGPLNQLLGLWLLLAAGSVALTHNYAGGRYLLPCVVPLSLLLAGDLSRMHRAWWALAVPGLLLAPALVYAERSHAQASLELPQQLGDREPGYFTGEWTFRWAMQERGWSFASPEEHLDPHSFLAVPTHSSPGPLNLDVHLVEVLSSSDQGQLRLIDLDHGVGYHAETLGPLPFAWVSGPRESLSLYQVDATP